MVKMVNGKVHPITDHEGPEVGQRYSSTLSLTSALDGGWVVNAKPQLLYPRERPGNHCIEGWVRPQGPSRQVKKISPPTGFDPQTVLEF